MIKLCTYVPETHLETVKLALFEAGAGKIGDYDCCSWQTKGLGQFRPLPGSEPFIGESGGEVETVVEYKLELVCEDQLLQAVITALKNSHPYEEPAFDLIQLMSVPI